MEDLDKLYKLGFRISYPGYFDPSLCVIQKALNYYEDYNINIMKEYSILYMITDDDYLCSDYIDIFENYNKGLSVRYKHHTLNHEYIIKICDKSIKHYKDMNTYKFRRKQASIKTSNKSFRKDFFNKKGKKCIVCGSSNNITIDHIIPIKKGGKDDLENLQPMCRSCNSSKGCNL